jgi:heptosyltransferase-2
MDGKNQKPKLLVVELWGMGDLVIATSFLRAASAVYDVTLVAKPYAQGMRPRLWPEVKVVPFSAPWTAFEQKYHLWRWPWPEIWKLQRTLRCERFDFGMSARWDPRDHFLVMLAGARERFGFPRVGSQVFLTRSLSKPPSISHRYENWRVMATALGLSLPPAAKVRPAPCRPEGCVLIHTGAGQPVRVWPLARYKSIAVKLRSDGYDVQIACDPDQEAWWREAGESKINVPQSVEELFSMLDRGAAFIGNDSGPGHLAAACGIPTMTIFGPQVPEWFAPLHPMGEWIEGKACPYKPCSDYCRFTAPICMTRTTEDETLARVQRFLHAVIAEPTLA